MNLDEAIDRYTNNAEYERTHGSLQGYLEFKQLAEWLKDYKRLLEQQPCEDAISRQAALNSLIDNTHLDGYDLAEALDAIENKEKLPPVTQIPIECDDAISREAVLKKIDYEVEHYCKYLEEVDDKRNAQTHVALVFDNIREEVEQLPSVTPKSIVCEDAISREELLKAIDTWDKFGYTETGCFVREPKGDYVPYIHYDDVIKCIKGMPPVTPQKYGEMRICPSCGLDVHSDFDYCPRCGAKMQESEE